MERKKDAAIVAAGSAIAAVAPGSEDLAFMHSVLCQVGLPRSKVVGNEFMRRQGAAWLNVHAGFLDEGAGPVQQTVPYGPMPRLALAWVSTYALANKTREVPIGNSAAEFLRLLGMDDQGNRYATLRIQTHALAACRLQLGYLGRTFSGQPIQQFDAWQHTKETGQKPLWPGVLVLSESYYKELQAGGVPLDCRALGALKGSALALDIYTWLAHRLHRLGTGGLNLDWPQLFGQFGQEYGGKRPLDDFRKAFRLGLKHALAVYPHARVTVDPLGLTLLASAPPVSKSVE